MGVLVSLGQWASVVTGAVDTGPAPVLWLPDGMEVVHEDRPAYVLGDEWYECGWWLSEKCLGNSNADGKVTLITAGKSVVTVPFPPPTNPER